MELFTPPRRTLLENALKLFELVLLLPMKLLEVVFGLLGFSFGLLRSAP